MALVVTVALVTTLTPTATASYTVPPGTAKQVAALVAASVNINKADATVLAELPNAANDFADRVYKIPALCNSPTACVYGDVTATTSLVLFGNSHARMWLPAIDPIAIKDQLRLVVLGKNECPVVSLALNAKKFPDCVAMTATVIKVINQLKPLAVILADRTVGTGYKAAQWQAGMTATITAIAPSHARVVLIGDIQEFDYSPLACVAEHVNAIKRNCTMKNPDSKLPGLESAERASANANHDLYINTTPWLCTTTNCSPVLGNFVGYWDRDHVTVSYAAYLSGVMATALASTLATG